MFRKRISAIALVMSLGITAVAPLAPIGVQDVYATSTAKAAGTSVIDMVPPTPSITRYSTSHWDATWFRSESNLQLGTCIYTIDADPTKNEVKTYNPDDYTITELPEELIGCDYIVNRINSEPHINHHFYAEQDIVIYAAIDSAQKTVPSSLKGFTKTEGTMRIKNGTEYWLAKRDYYAGQVVLDKYNGAGNKVFYMIMPQNGKAVSQVLADNGTVQVEEGEKPEKNAADENYQYYLNSVFNIGTEEKILADYTVDNASLSALAGEEEEPPTEPIGEKTYAADENKALGKPVYGNNKNEESTPVDGDDQTYYEASRVPSELTVALQAPTQINKVVMSVRNKESWGTRTQNVEVRISDDNENFETVVAAKDYDFKYDEKITLEFDTVTAKYIQLLGTSNTGAAGMQIAEFEVYGPEETVELWPEPEPKPELGDDLNRWVVVDADGNMTKTFDAPVTGKVIYEGKVMASANEEMSIPVMKSSDGKTAVDLTFGTDGMIKAGGQDVVEYEAGKWHVIKMLVDTEAKTYDVYVDHMRKAQAVPFTEDAKDIASISWTAGEGTLYVDNVRLYDNPEIYVIKDNFNDETTGVAQPANWTVSDTTKSAVQNVPFVSDKSLQIVNDGSKVTASRTFGALEGDVTIEAKVKPMEDSWVTVPVVRDSKGEAVLKVAAYRNSFFISNGNNWEYLCSQETKHNYYPVANWYNIKIVLNTYSNRYDFYIDGAKRFSQASFAADVDDVATVDFVTEEENVLYIDNVNVYDSASLARGLYPAEDVFNVRDYGAVGDGVTDDTAAIEAAMKDAAYTGGTVLLENGTFYCGQITMQNDMTLFIDASATIFFKMNRNDYVHFQPKYNGVVGYNGNHQLGAGLIRSIEGNNNFRINGGGTLDGNGFYAFNENDPGNQRPCALYLTSSDDFSVENINIINSPHWTFVPYESTRMTIRNIGITNHIAPNRDGIDPVNCSNMTIENCYIFAGDDALCPKSGNAFPSINCDVRNVTMQSYCNGIKFGTDSYDDFKNYTFEDILIKNVGLSAITLQAVDGSEIENITFKRVDMIDVDNSIAFMVGNRQRANAGLTKHLGHIKGVTIEDMSYTNPMTPPFSHQNENEHANMFVALDPNKHNGEKTVDHIISDVSLKNVYLEMPGGYTEVPGISGGINTGYPEHGGMGNPTGWANTIRWARDITYDNCQSVLLTDDVRTEYDYKDYYSGENLNEGVEGKIKYGIVFEDNGKVLTTPVLSGVISPGESATVLNYSLIQALKDDKDFILDKAKYEGAVITCDEDGELVLTDIRGNVLAEAVMEKFSNEAGERLVFHLAGEKNAEAASGRARIEALNNAANYGGQDDQYAYSTWREYETAYDAVKNMPYGTSLEEQDALTENLVTATGNLARKMGTWIESESGIRTGGASIESSGACSGGASSGWLGTSDNGNGRVSFKIYAREAGDYEVSVYYCQDATRTLNIEVNGEDNAVACASTGNWNTPSAEPVTTKIALQEGVNEVVFTGLPGAGAPNVDRFMIGTSQEQTVSDYLYAVEDVKLEASDYTAESWAAYEEALENAKELDPTTESEETIKEAIEDIKKAEKALVTVESIAVAEAKEKLSAAVAAVEGKKYVESAYTAESWKVYADALKAAKEVLNAKNAKEATVNTILAELNAAEKALKTKPAGGNVTPPAGGGNATPPADGGNEKPGNEKPGTGKPADVKVSSIKITGISKKIAAGKKVTLSATVAPANATVKAVKWSSSNTKWATVNANGKVSVKKAGKNKTVTITATATDGSGKKATYKIKIMPNAVKKITVKASGKTLKNNATVKAKAGKTVKLKATVSPSKKVNKTLEWTSSNKKWATVDKKGNVKTKKAGKGKTVRITAQTTDGSNKKITIKVKIAK